jgi:Fe-S-cluster containining protein
MTGECSCDNCKGACTHRPGWFLPGEAEKAAEYLRIPLEELFREGRIMVDWWWLENGHDAIFLLAPGVDTGTPGEEYPLHPNGVCRFYDAGKGLCTIHPVKPYECREYMHTDTNEQADRRHEQVAMVWSEPRNRAIALKQIRKLLGREPRTKHPTQEDILNILKDIEKEDSGEVEHETLEKVPSKK